MKIVLKTRRNDGIRPSNPARLILKATIEVLTDELHVRWASKRTFDRVVHQAFTKHTPSDVPSSDKISLVM